MFVSNPLDVSRSSVQGRTKENEKAVLGSPMLAKGLVRLEDGRLEMIVVFHESTRNEFYWVFAVKNARTPRRAMKKRMAYKRECGVYKDFHSFVNWYATMHKAKVVSIRIMQKKRLASSQVKTKHDFLSGDWREQDLHNATFDLVQKRYSAFKTRGFYLNRRNRANDIERRMTEHIFVYEDWCDECMSRHAYAHFPNGEDRCKVGYAEMKKNPGFEYVGFKPSEGFRFRYRILTPALPVNDRVTVGAD